MREFQAHGQTISAYLAVPEHGSGPGVVVLHAWWDLTDVFKHVCDRLARAGFIALAPDLYHGKTTASVEQAQALGEALDQDVPRWRGDITAAMQIVRQQAASNQADGRGRLTIVGFSLRGACALDMSVNLAEEIAAVVTFYDFYPGLDYSRAQAAYLCYFAQEDQFVPAEPVAQMEQQLRATGKAATIYTYPGTRHWFAEENRPEYDAEATHLAWERTIAFLHKQLD